MVKDKDRRRSSRADTQAETRQRVLDAAEAAFAAEGFGGASLDRIAEAAGFTRGAVYSNFADKADLFVGVLDRHLERRAAEVATVLAEAERPEDVVAAVRTPPWRAARSRDDERRWMLLHDEFRLFALRHPAAAERLARHERHQRDYFARAAAHLLALTGTEPPVDLRLGAAILLALDQSLIRQHTVDPDDVPATAFADALDFLLRAAAALAER